MTVSSSSVSYGYPHRSVTLGDVKKRLMCPISDRLLQDPVKAFPCGHHFETGKLDLGKSICPIDARKVERVEIDKELIAVIERFNQLSKSVPDEACGSEVAELYVEIQRCQEAVNYERDLAAFTEEGLYFLTFCKKEGCDQYNKGIWVNQGVGDFEEISLKLERAHCKTCSDLSLSVGLIALKAKEYGWEGRIKRGEGKEKIQSETTEGTEVKTLYFPALSEWKFLTIRVGKLVAKESAKVKERNCLQNIAASVSNCFYYCCCCCFCEDK